MSRAPLARAQQEGVLPRTAADAQGDAGDRRCHDDATPPEWRVRRARTRLCPAEIVSATIDALPYIRFPRALNAIFTAKTVFEGRYPPPVGGRGA